MLKEQAKEVGGNSSSLLFSEIFMLKIYLGRRSC
jgi:hypothetical protein